jgi:seryl-tRNA synthetase
MLDRKYILEKPATVKENCARRGVAVDIDRFVELETRRRALDSEVQELNRRANEVSKTIGQAKDAQEREARKEEGRRLREEKETKQKELDGLAAELDVLHVQIPNMSHPLAPHGGAEANAELRRGKTPIRQFAFKPRDHVAIAEALDLVDLEGGARVAGHGFYFLKNEAVLLELALQQYAVSFLVRKGYTPLVTPDLARNEILSGIGFLPRGPETQIYSIENTDLSLVATAEITLGGLFAKQILDEEQLPIRLCGVSHCFRTEAGAHGRATRGIYRVHQFTKVEMFAFTTPQQSEGLHDEICQLECDIFDGLGIPYRVIDTATGDLGGPAYRKFDLEAWMPGRTVGGVSDADGAVGEWGEITSTSNCTDYQARRLGIRYKSKGQQGTHFAHTLNGTAVAISRALIAILENYQMEDGSVEVPKALRPWVGKDVIASKERRAKEGDNAERLVEVTAAVKAAAEKAKELYNAVPQGLSFDEIERFIKSLDRLSKEDKIAVAREFGITNPGRTGKQALDQVKQEMDARLGLLHRTDFTDDERRRRKELEQRRADEGKTFVDNGQWPWQK